MTDLYCITLEYENKNEMDLSNEWSLCFPSEESYEKAMDWYNSQSKKQILHFCEGQGISLNSRKKNTLLEHWTDLAMAVYAWSEYPVTKQFGEDNVKYMPIIQHIKKIQIELYEAS